VTASVPGHAAALGTDESCPARGVANRPRLRFGSARLQLSIDGQELQRDEHRSDRRDLVFRSRRDGLCGSGTKLDVYRGCGGRLEVQPSGVDGDPAPRSPSEAVGSSKAGGQRRLVPLHGSDGSQSVGRLSAVA
jgi:hypothetical protein